MELMLSRNEENFYELRLGSVVLAQSDTLSAMLDRAQHFAKKFRKKLFISQASISDWYIGFPNDREQSPEIFFDPHYMLKAATVQEGTPTYRFVEGPFLSQEQAAQAAFGISGKVAKLIEC